MITICLDREYTLLFDDRALLRARDQFNLDVKHLLKIPQSLRTLRVLVVCGLSHEADAPSFKRIKKLITEEHAVEGSPLWLDVGRALAEGRGFTHG